MSAEYGRRLRGGVKRRRPPCSIVVSRDVAAGCGWTVGRSNSRSGAVMERSGGFGRRSARWPFRMRVCSSSGRRSEAPLARWNRGRSSRDRWPSTYVIWPDRQPRTVRSHRSAGPGAPGSADSAGPSPIAGTAGRPNRVRSRSGANARTDRTSRGAGRRADQTVGRRRASGDGGEGGIRTHEVFRLSAFQERRHQPLGHLSGREDTSE